MAKSSVTINVEGRELTVELSQLDSKVHDAVADFFYYNRKSDEELPCMALEEAVRAGLLNEDELVAMFRKHIHKRLTA